MSGQRKVLVERLDIVNQRINYLSTIKKKREEGFKTVYLDETWCDTNHTTSHQWAAEDDSKKQKITISKRPRICDFTCRLWRWVSKWLWTCFNGISTDGRYYYVEMNSKIFEKWVNEQLEPALPTKEPNNNGQCFLP